MPTDLAQLTTAFSGLQLIVIVFVLMEVRALREYQKAHRNDIDKQGAEISRLNGKVSNVMGRLKIDEED